MPAVACRTALTGVAFAAASPSPAATPAPATATLTPLGPRPRVPPAPPIVVMRSGVRGVIARMVRRVARAGFARRPGRILCAPGLPRSAAPPATTAAAPARPAIAATLGGSAGDAGMIVRNRLVVMLGARTGIGGGMRNVGMLLVHREWRSRPQGPASFGCITLVSAERPEARAGETGVSHPSAG